MSILPVDGHDRPEPRVTSVPGSAKRSRLGKWAAGAWGVAVVGALGAVILGGAGKQPVAQYVVVGYNELGMHCMNQDFSELMILPPFNTVRATVIRKGREPTIVQSGVTIKYSFPNNTHSTDKTNFWMFAPRLFGATFPADVGLGGFGLAGTMISRSPAANDWEATGVPLTPIDDDGKEDAYQTALITAEIGGQVVARTQAVVPVSWEISCFLCHQGGPNESISQNILRAHDRMHGTTLATSTPVNCSQCHSDNALGAPGVPGVPSLSHAMHGSHANRMAAAGLAVNCYACHPGVRTQCQRDIHSQRGMDCYSCHGQMADVAAPARRPWLDEPSCRQCHQPRQPEYDFELPGELFRNATGHGGVKCVVCHSAPHAVTPTVTGVDNLQSQRLMGHTGPLGSLNGCTACHTTPPGPFEHHRRD